MADELLAAAALADGDHGLGDARVGGQDGLDLAGLDAEAAHLHLGVVAARVLQLPGGVPARQVAGAVHARAGRAVGVGDEPVGGQGGAAEVAAADLAGDVQLADHTGRDGPQAGAEDVGADVAERGADGGAARAVPLLVGGQGEGGGVERLALAVGVDHADAGDRLADAPHEGGGERLTGEDHGVGADAVAAHLAEEFREDGRDGADHAAAPAAALADHQCVTHQFDGAAGAEGREDLEDGHVEVDRGAGQYARPGADADGRGQSKDVVDHVGVGDRDALGGTGGAGGVDDVGGLARPGTGDGRRVLRVLRVLRAAGADVADEQARDLRLRQYADGLRVGQDQRGRGVLEDEVEAAAGVSGVDRQVGPAGLEHAQQSRHQVRGARQGDAHEGLGADAAHGELPRDPGGPRVEFAVGEGLVPGLQRDRVRGGGGLPLEELADRDPRQLDGGVVELAHHGVEFVLVQDGGQGDRAVRTGDDLTDHPQVAVHDGLRRGAVEQVGGVLQVAEHARALGVREVVELQVELGGRGGEHLEARLLQARQLQVDPGVVLPGEHDLEQRVVGGGALRVQDLH